MDLAAPQRREEAASLVGLRVAKQAELDAVVRQSADLSERVRAGSDAGRLDTSSCCVGPRSVLHAPVHVPCQAANMV